MKILNREQGLDDGRIIYEQDLDRRASSQQHPPRNIAGKASGDFVAEGIEEQANTKRYREISRLVMTDPARKLNEMARVQ